MPIEDRPVPQDASVRTAATQPFPVGADRVLPDCGEWRDRGTPPGFEVGCFFAPTSFKTPNLLAPFFGMRVAPMAYSPQTGYFYAVGNAWLRWRRRAQDPYFFSPDRRVPGVSDFAVLAAIDSRTNKIAWRKELRTGRLPGGAMPTAGGLMFQAAGDGNLQAYDAKSGEIAWQFQTGVPGGGPVMSYEVDGEQYVAFASTSVWAFKLGGTALTPAPAPRAPADDLFVGAITDTSQIETASLARDMGLTGARQMTDEYTFSPTRAREGRHGGHVDQQRHDGAHDRRARRVLDDGPAQSDSGRRREVRQAGDLHLHVQGTSMGSRSIDRRRIARGTARLVIRHEDAKTENDPYSYVFRAFVLSWLCPV